MSDMFNGVRWPWCVLGFLMSLLATGSILWTTPYSQLSLPNSLYSGVLVFVVLGAVIARVPGRAGFLLATILVGAAVPVANAWRVHVDTAKDPTSHNLFPLELFLSGMVGVVCAGAGSLGVTLWKFLFGKK